MKRCSWYTKIQLHHPSPSVVQAVRFNNLLEKIKRYSWYSRYRNFLPQNTVCAFVSKCESVFSFVWFIPIFALTTKRNPCLTYSVRVHPRAFSLSASDLKRTLAGLLSKVSRHKTHYKYKSSFHDFFCTFLLSACKSLSCRMDWGSLYCSKSAFDNDSWIYPKARPFRNFQTIESPLHYFNNLMQAFIFFVQMCDFSQPFISDSNFYILFLTFIIHLNNFTHFLFSL